MTQAPTFCARCASRLEERDVAGRRRLVCSSPSCGQVVYDNPTPVVAALVEHEGKIVLARGAGWPEGMFGLVTGFLERDESPEQGALRELKEELDLDGTIERLIGVYPFTVRNEVIIAYHVKAEGVITLSDEIVAVKAIDPDKLRPWPMGTGLAVHDWITARRKAAQ